MKSLVLIGPPCSGKKSVGKQVAELAGIPFVDADDEFKTIHGPIDEYVVQHDWAGFRGAETDVLQYIAIHFANQPIVLATGDDAVTHNQGEQYRQQNVEALQKVGTVVYLLPFLDLTQSAQVLTARMQNNGNGEDNQLREMVDTLTKRDSLYGEVASYPLITGKMTIDKVAKQLHRFQYQQPIST